MRIFSTAIAITIALVLAAPLDLTGQRVIINGATPQEVIQNIHKRINAQGFRLDDSSEKEAVFVVDRGFAQTTYRLRPYRVPLVLEFQLRFKPTDEGLEVNAYEELVKARGNGTLEWRDPVRSRAERDTMQRLLDEVKKELEARVPAPETSHK